MKIRSRLDSVAFNIAQTEKSGGANLASKLLATAKPPTVATAFPVAPPAADEPVAIARFGKTDMTLRVNAWFGTVWRNAPSTNACTCSCNNFRPRESRCRAASSDKFMISATRSMESFSR